MKSWPWGLIISTLAILLSPLIAIRVSVWLQNRNEKRTARSIIFMSLMALRYMPPSDEIVRALNMIDLVFSDHAKIRKLWREYYEMLSNKETSTLWEDKRDELITEMAKEVGYGKTITMMDIKRVYFPVGLLQEKFIAKANQEQLYRLLSQSEAIAKTGPLPPEKKN